MQNTLPNNKIPHPSSNIILTQPKNPTTNNNTDKKSKESTDVLQDKGVLTNERARLRQPAVFNNGVRTGDFLDNNSERTQNHFTREKLIPTTFHLKPGVRAELEIIARREALSLSQVGATACEEWVRYDIHRQHESILIPTLKQVMREELQAFGNRIVFFLLKIAFPAEQARILTTNVLKWVVKLAGLDLKAYYKMVDESSSMSRKNIIAKSPQIKALMDKWEGMFTEDKSNTQWKEGTEKNGRRNA